MSRFFKILKEEPIAQIKDQIVDQALKQIQDHSTVKYISEKDKIDPAGIFHD